MNKLVYHGHTLPSLHDDGFGKSTSLPQFILVWFPEELCLIFSIHSFIGRMYKLNTSYWLETEPFFKINNSDVPLETHYHDSKSETQLFRFQTFPENKMFCNIPRLYIPLRTLTSLKNIKKGLICTLVKVTLFCNPVTKLKMNKMIDSPSNFFLII